MWPFTKSKEKRMSPEELQTFVQQKWQQKQDEQLQKDQRYTDLLFQELTRKISAGKIKVEDATAYSVSASGWSAKVPNEVAQELTERLVEAGFYVYKVSSGYEVRDVFRITFYISTNVYSSPPDLQWEIQHGIAVAYLK